MTPSLQHWLTPRRASAAAVVLLLVLSIAVTLVPVGFGAPWPWARDRNVPALGALRRLNTANLDAPGWSEGPLSTQRIGSGQWTVLDLLSPTGRPNEVDAPAMADNGAIAVTVAMLPMKTPVARPQVEWSDWLGMARLQTDSVDRVTVPRTGGGEFQARVLRGWDDRNVTYAVIQWYAWVGGGDPRPDRWFWHDFRQQLRGDRVPWVAVVGVIQTRRPLDPLDEYLPTLKDAAAAVQTALENGPLSANSKEGA